MSDICLKIPSFPFIESDSLKFWCHDYLKSGFEIKYNSSERESNFMILGKMMRKSIKTEVMKIRALGNLQQKCCILSPRVKKIRLP